MPMTTCTLPDDIEVEVDFSWEDNQPCCEQVYLNEKRLDWSRFMVEVQDKEGCKYIKLVDYINDQLDKKINELLEDEYNSYEETDD